MLIYRKYLTESFLTANHCNHQLIIPVISFLITVISYVQSFIALHINKEVLNSEDFEEKDGGFYLEDKPRKDYFLYYEKYLQRKFSYEGEELNFRRLFQIQTQKMAKTIQEKVPYHYFLMK